MARMPDSTIKEYFDICFDLLFVFFLFLNFTLFFLFTAKQLPVKIRLVGFVIVIKITPRGVSVGLGIPGPMVVTQTMGRNGMKVVGSTTVM